MPKQTKQNSQQILAHAEAQCRANSARLTDKRKNVLLCLLDSEKALSAYDVAHTYLEKFSEKISAMSVYRILEFLEQQHLVHKLQLANKYVSCVHISCNHEHQASQFLICIECSKVKEVSIERDIVERFMSNVSEAGFELASPQLEVNCVCDECKNKNGQDSAR